MAVTLRYDWSNRENKTEGVLSEPSLTDVTSAVALALTRATTASVTDYNGIIKQVKSGEERYTGARRVENLCKQSEDFRTTWGLGGNTRDNADTANVAVAPDGATTADRIIDSSGGGSGSGVSAFQARVLSAMSTHCYSMYMKADGIGWASMTSTGFDASANGASWFDLTGGVVGTKDANHSSTGIEDVGDGWFRCWVLFTTGAGDLNGFIALNVAGADATNTVDLDGTSSIFVWGGQLENVSGQADPSPSEYRTTTTESVSKWYATNQAGAAINPTGLLVEEARTNICLRSDQFDQSPWALTGTAGPIGVDAATAPDGRLVADRLIDSNAGGTDVVRVGQDVTIVDATTYTFSCYVKADGLDWVLIWFDRGTSVIAQFFDLTNGVIGTGSGSAPDNAFIEDVGDGWFRCSITGVSNGTAGELRIHLGDSDGDVTVALDGTSSIFLWGAQLEAGAFPTSYIPTVAASVTRNADDVKTTDMTWFDPLKGTMYVEFMGTFDPPASGDRQAVAAHGTSTSNMYSIGFRGASDIIHYQHVTNPGTDGRLTGSFLVNGTMYRGVNAFAEDDMQVATDGLLGGSLSSLTVPTGGALNSFTVGAVTGQQWNGHIAEIIYDNTRKIDAELEDWSNGINLPEVTSAALTGILFPRDAMPTDEERFKTFIADAGGTSGVDITTDYRNALATLLGYTEAQALTRSVQDLFKEYVESL